MSDLRDVRPDEWLRFDLWAERAHGAAQAAIEAERARGDAECTGGLTDAYSRAADIYRDLAQASAPIEPVEPQSTEPVVVVK